MEENQRSKKLEKIRKLLALRDGAGTEGEAMAAAAQAGKMITELGIEEGDVIRDSDQSIKVGEKIFEYKSGRSKAYIHALSSGLGRLCGCFVYKSKLRSPVSYKVIGYQIMASGKDRDILVLNTLFPSMLDSVEKLKKARGGRDSAGYALGLALGLIDRMNAEQNAILESIKVYSLVPVDRSNEAEKETSKHIKLKSGKGGRVKKSAYMKGREDSKNLKIAGQHQAVRGTLALGE